MKTILTTLFLGVSLFLTTVGFAEEAKAPTAEEKQAMIDTEVNKYPAVKAAVSAYMTALEKQDFDGRYNLESWQGGSAPDKIRYLSMIDTDFQVYSWKITKIEEDKKSGHYKVLVLTTHNPPQQVAAFLKGKKEVRSTLRQWWGKEDGKFKHLFFIERQQMQQLLAPPKIPKPVEPEDLKPAKPDTKLENT